MRSLTVEGKNMFRNLIFFFFSEPGSLPAQQSALPLPTTLPSNLRYGGDHSHKRQLHQGGATQRCLEQRRPIKDDILKRSQSKTTLHPNFQADIFGVFPAMDVMLYVTVGYVSYYKISIQKWYKKSNNDF
jgi:hypothetical protein